YGPVDGGVAGAIFAEAAPLTVATRQVLLEGHPVALAHTPALRRHPPDSRDVPDVLVSHDVRRAATAAVGADVAATDASRFYFQEPRVDRDVGHRKFAQLRLLGGGLDRRYY